MEQITKGLLSWASILADNTREQAIQTASLPFVKPHMALMPDAHLGKGATVGSVIPTRGAIIPAAVGVDIGCGMVAVRTPWAADELREAGSLTALREDIEWRIPLSAGKYNQGLSPTATPRVRKLENRASALNFDPYDYAANWWLQLGSLGSGNHFIEVSEDELGRVWIVLHSGSRGVGNKIAQHHISVARGLMERYFITLPDPDLAYLVEGTEEFDQYINEMTWAQEFAWANRLEMMDRVRMAVSDHMGCGVFLAEELVHCHHNYTTREHHFDQNLWVTRKGAIDAHEGVMGIIPGSMGTASYIVEGLGNKASFCSAPHGAGREFSRTKARQEFTHDDLREAMKGIEYRDTDAFIDEIPGAYKNIDQVMEDAKDLVEIQHTLRQLVNVKGD